MRKDNVRKREREKEKETEREGGERGGREGGEREREREGEGERGLIEIMRKPFLLPLLQNMCGLLPITLSVRE